MTKKADWRIEDLEDRVAAAEKLLAQVNEELRQFQRAPRNDTSTPESVRYHIKFHQSQQEKKRKKTG